MTSKTTIRKTMTTFPILINNTTSTTVTATTSTLSQYKPGTDACGLMGL